jgi:hypothetical protein
MEALGHQHNTPEWRLFINSSKVSLKVVLLHNENKYPSVPLAHAVNMKESCENMKLLLEKIHYEKFYTLSNKKNATLTSYHTRWVQISECMCFQKYEYIKFEVRTNGCYFIKKFYYLQAVFINIHKDT